MEKLITQETSVDPPVVRRITAWVIDMAILVFVSIQLEKYFLVRVTELITYILVGVVVVGYFLLKDAIGGRSVGKLCVGIRTVDMSTDQPVSLIQSIKRNGVVVFLLTLAVVLTQIARFIVGDDIAANIGAGLIDYSWPPMLVSVQEVVRPHVIVLPKQQ